VGKKSWRHKAWEGAEAGLEAEKAEGPLRYGLFPICSLLNGERAVDRSECQIESWAGDEAMRSSQRKEGWMEDGEI